MRNLNNDYSPETKEKNSLISLILVKIEKYKISFIPFDGCKHAEGCFSYTYILQAFDFTIAYHYAKAS